MSRVLHDLYLKIKGRKQASPSASYSAMLFERGTDHICQKVGEEAVELVIEAKDSNDELFKNEAADLLYHLLILLKSKNASITQREEILKKRNQKLG